MRIIVLALAVVLTFAQASTAQQKYPDMLGTWTGSADRVVSDADGEIEFRTDPLTIVFTEQRDRRFVGHLVVEDDEISIIGVFLDRTTFRWAEAGGFADGRLLHPDTFEACYVRIAEYSKIGACERMDRQK